MELSSTKEELEEPEIASEDIVIQQEADLGSIGRENRQIDKQVHSIVNQYHSWFYYKPPP